MVILVWHRGAKLSLIMLSQVSPKTRESEVAPSKWPKNWERIGNVKTWSSAKCKNRRNGGRVFVSDITHKKWRQNPCENHALFKKCFEKIEDKESTSDAFWDLADFNGQNANLVGQMELTGVKRRYPEKRKHDFLSACHNSSILRRHGTEYKLAPS
ncbi:uncharacterized protein LOC124802700 isoform X2 [Schistocerca piceifrons]|nr:uncharacterized protein LOC124802700 isoform X2 [Schistocerca piceifrons]